MSLSSEGVLARAGELSPFQLALAAGLVLFAGLVSLAYRLQLEKRLLIGAVRTTLQLVLIGYTLRYVFEFETPWPLFLVALVMTLLAGRAATRRVAYTLVGMQAAAFLSLFATGFLTTVVVTKVVLQAEPFYAPQTFLPLLGMVLGNTLTGISLTLDHLLAELHGKRDHIEAELALGATPFEASRPLLRASLRRGMIPTINAMMVVGIVSLPGMMTGQILAGADPMVAVQYQIVVMFMLAGGTSLGCMLIATLMLRRAFGEACELREDVISRRQEV